MTENPTSPPSQFSGTPAENYERYFVPTIGIAMAEDLINAAALSPGERVLDVACGTGLMARLAAPRVGDEGSVSGLDVNPGMLDVARSLAANPSSITWYETSAEAMPLESDSFDVVLCQMGLQFVADKLQALKEIRRVLRPGGRLVLNLPGPTPEPFNDFAEALQKHIDPKYSGFVNVVFALHDRAELRGLMQDAGFDEIDIDKTTKSLRLPKPEDFMWQYIYSTPMAELVGKANDTQRRALAADVVARWQRFVVDADMHMDVPMTTVRAR